MKFWKTARLFIVLNFVIMCFVNCGGVVRQHCPVMRCPAFLFTNYKFGLLCRLSPPDLVGAATPFFPWLVPRLPSDCISMGAGASHGKVHSEALHSRNR